MEFRIAMICLGLLGLATGCAAVEPLGGGRIHTRCSRTTDGGLVVTHPCGDNQYALCQVNTDAGNGQVFARCCNNNETDEACARSAGISGDAGTTQ